MFPQTPTLPSFSSKKVSLNMKRLIIITLVVAGTVGVIALKKSKRTTSSQQKGPGLCPCKMAQAAQTNQTESGTANSE